MNNGKIIAGFALGALAGAALSCAIHDMKAKGKCCPACECGEECECTEEQECKKQE